MRDMVAELRRVVRQGAETAQTTGNGPFRAQRRWRVAWVAALAVALAVVGTLLGSRLRQRGEPVDRQYTQLTNFADSVVSPALSPDGRMLTFIRGEDTLTGLGQIYVKLLPDGDAVQLTNDTYAKMSPKFTPDERGLSIRLQSDRPQRMTQNRPWTRGWCPHWGERRPVC